YVLGVVGHSAQYVVVNPDICGAAGAALTRWSWGGSSAAGVQLGHEVRRRDGPVRVLAQLGDLVPVRLAVQPYPDPAAAPDVRRAEVPLRRGGDQRLLRAGRRRADQVREVVLVVAVLPEAGERDPVTDEPGRRAVAGPLGDLGKGQADRSDPVSETSTDAG